MRTICLAIIALALPSALNAQSARPTPNTALLRCGRPDTLEVYLVHGGNRRRTGMVVDQCQVSSNTAEPTLTRVYRSEDALLGNRVDTIVDSWKSLAPRQYHSHSSSETVQLDWEGTRLHGMIKSNDKPSLTAVDEEFRQDAYDGASLDFILRASPLAPNYTTAVPLYVEGRGIITVTAKVAAEEVIDGRPSWRVDADFGGMPVSFWIAKDTRQLVKQVMHVSGAEIEFIAPRRPQA